MSGRTNPKHRKILRDSIQGVTKPAIQRLCRRAGVKSASSVVYYDIRALILSYLQSLMKIVVEFSKVNRRKVIMVEDVINALGVQGTKLAFGKKQQISRC